MQTSTIELNDDALFTEPLDSPWRPEPCGPIAPPAAVATPLELIEEMLKRPAIVDARMRDVPRLGKLVPRMVLISMAGYTAFCLAAAMTLSLSPSWPAGVPRSESALRTWLALFAAYDIGILLAIGICLPSFYFYTLLAGVRITMLETVAHALKGHAVAAVVLIGMLPFYVAITLGLQVFDAPETWRVTFDYLLLTLPFQAGVFGAASLYRGFTQLCDTMPARFARRRDCFLRRLLLSWTICSTVITPLAIYTIWASLARV